MVFSNWENAKSKEIDLSSINRYIQHMYNQQTVSKYLRSLSLLLCVKIPWGFFCCQFTPWESLCCLPLLWRDLIVFSRNYTKLAMFAFLYCFVLKTKIKSGKKFTSNEDWTTDSRTVVSLAFTLACLPNSANMTLLVRLRRSRFQWLIGAPTHHRRSQRVAGSIPIGEKLFAIFFLFFTIQRYKNVRIANFV